MGHCDGRITMRYGVNAGDLTKLPTSPGFVEDSLKPIDDTSTFMWILVSYMCATLLVAEMSFTPRF